MLNPRYHSINLVALNFIRLLIYVHVVTTELPHWRKKHKRFLTAGGATPQGACGLVEWIDG